MTIQEADFTTPDPYDSMLRSFATRGIRHQAEAGGRVAEGRDADFDENRQAWRAARGSLATVMILRHIKRVAPELMAELVDLNLTAELLSEFGVMVKLDSYIREAGGSPEVVFQHLEMMKKGDAA